jgi:pimeloyl-ACP methyl ester carboxylesterase
MPAVGFEASVAGGVLEGEVGGDGPPVVVVHGGPGLSRVIVEGLVAELVPSYRTAVYQQRGVPPSTEDGAFTIDEALADFAAVLDHLGWDRAYLVGSSWGGHLAFWAAVALPERLLGVLAVDPLGAVGDGGNADFEAEMAARTPQRDRERAAELDRLAQHGETSEEQALESLRLFWPAYFADPPTAPPMPEPMRLSIPAYAGLFGDLLARLPELEASLPDIRVPFGVLVGDRSPIPNSASRASAERIPDAWLDVVKNAGHLPWHERPGCVRAALDRLSGRAA